VKRYIYKAVAKDGAPVEGEIDAADERAVVDNLQQSGLLPISMRELSTPAFSGSFAGIFAQRVGTNDVNNLTRELATMLMAGLPLVDAFTTLTSLATKPAIRDLIDRIRAKVVGGATFSDALRDSNGPFSILFISIIRAGEATGTLDVVLQRLTEYQQQSKQLREAVLSAFIYPAILVLVAGSALAILLVYVVPQFEPMFQELGAALPWSTQLVIGLSGFFGRYWWLLLLSVAGIYSSVRLLAEQLELRRRWDSSVLRLPLLGELFTKIEITTLCRTLGTVTSNGVALLDGVRLVRDGTSNSVIAATLDTVATKLESGRGFSKPLAESKQFPDLAIQLIRVGEETGGLSAMLLKIADIYDEEVKISLKRLLTILEPTLILTIGLLIAFIVISILLALLALNDLVV
jgi:general secretion pathway protein F